MGTISDDLAVEVIGSTNAWYKAWVIDVFNTSALCTFENGWKNDVRVQFMRIRIPPEFPTNYGYALNEEVEVLSNTNPKCWWPATINLVSDDKNTFSIQYKTCGTGDLVGRDRIRPLIPSKFLHPSTFLKYSIEVPEVMRDCADIEGVLDEAAFKSFKEKTNASLIRYDKPTNMIIVLTPHLEVLRKVEKCFEYQLSLLESKVDILQRKKRYTAHLKEPVPKATEHHSDSQPLSHHQVPQFTDEFTIEPNFMGLAIGTRGKNINEARRIPGIIGLDLNEDYCLFKIVGETKEAVEKARNMLEYGDMTINVDFDIASRVIGKKGNVVQSLIDRSGCVRVRLENFVAEDGSANNITKFIFTGTKQALKDVDILMDCTVNHARETMALNEHNKQADSMLRNKIYNKPSPRNAPLMTPRAPITPPYPNNEQEQGKKITPVAPNDEGPQKIDPSQTYLQTPTVQQVQPRMARLTIETQTEPLDDSQFIKPAPPHMPEPKQEDTRAPSPRMPLQKRTSYPPFRDSNYRPASDNNGPRETYRMNVRDPSRRPRENVRENTRVLTAAVPRDSTRVPVAAAAVPRENARVAASAPPRGIAKPVHPKPKVDIKLANEKIGSALGNVNNKVIKVEDLRTEQQAAIEDLVKAEANKVTCDEDKENNQKSGPVNNQNIKVDNQPKNENENITKEQPLIQTIQASEALVCEFSPAS